MHLQLSVLLYVQTNSLYVSLPFPIVIKKFPHMSKFCSECSFGRYCTSTLKQIAIHCILQYNSTQGDVSPSPLSLFYASLLLLLRSLPQQTSHVPSSCPCFSKQAYSFLCKFVTQIFVGRGLTVYLYIILQMFFYFFSCVFTMKFIQFKTFSQLARRCFVSYHPESIKRTQAGLRWTGKCLYKELSFWIDDGDTAKQITFSSA